MTSPRWLRGAEGSVKREQLQSGGVIQQRDPDRRSTGHRQIVTDSSHLLDP
jgi:hypothetical protein